MKSKAASSFQSVPSPVNHTLSDLPEVDDFGDNEIRIKSSRSQIPIQTNKNSIAKPAKKPQVDKLPTKKVLAATTSKAIKSKVALKKVSIPDDTSSIVSKPNMKTTFRNNEWSGYSSFLKKKGATIKKNEERELAVIEIILKNKKKIHDEAPEWMRWYTCC